MIFFFLHLFLLIISFFLCVFFFSGSVILIPFLFIMIFLLSGEFVIIDRGSCRITAAIDRINNKLDMELLQFLSLVGALSNLTR